MPNIAIVWDFDGTLTPIDSTTIVAEILSEGSGNEFWDTIHKLKGDKPKTGRGSKEKAWEHILAMDAPVWMYALSRLAFALQIPLNAETFKVIAPEIKLYPNVAPFLRKLKGLERTAAFKKVGLEIHHFIVSAGLKDLVGQILPNDLIRWTFGCCYQVNAFEGNPNIPESIPVFCMDETMKTRSLYEISKGSFQDKTKSVNSLVPNEKRWAPFENMIYVGDGFTDVPSFSLVRSLGGLGIAVYNPKKSKAETNDRLKRLRLDKRTDLITPADFAASSELYGYLKGRCTQIALRYRAARPV